MPEENDQNQEDNSDNGDSGDDKGSWLDEHKDLSAEDRKLYEGKNFPDALTMLKAGADTYRKMGKSVHWPDEKTSDEDKAKFTEKLNTYNKVPANPEGYVIDTSDLPEGVEPDENMIKWFRQNAFDAKAPQSTVTNLVAAWNKMQIENHDAVENIAKEDEKNLRKEWGDEFDVKIGKPDSDKIGTVKMGLLQLSTILGLNYKDDAGNPQSHLIDCLEMNRKDGMLGDKIPIIKVFDWVYQNCFAEGKTFFSEGGGPKKDDMTTDGFWDKLYDNPDNKPEEGGYEFGK